MALGTVKLIKQGNAGEMGFSIVDVQLTSGANYSSGGEAFDIAQIPGAKGTLIAVVTPPAGQAATPLAASVSWDQTNKKLVLYGTAAGATGVTQATAAGDFSGQVARCICFYTTIG